MMNHLKRLIALLSVLMLLCSCALSESFPYSSKDYAASANRITAELLGVGKTSFKKGTLQMKTLEPCYVTSDDAGNLVSITSTVTVDMEDSAAIATTLQNFGMTVAAVVYAARLQELEGDMTALAADAANITSALSAIEQVNVEHEAVIEVAGGILRLSVDADMPAAKMTWNMSFSVH